MVGTIYHIARALGNRKEYTDYEGWEGGGGRKNLKLIRSGGAAVQATPTRAADVGTLYIYIQYSFIICIVKTNIYIYMLAYIVLMHIDNIIYIFNIV